MEPVSVCSECGKMINFPNAHYRSLKGIADDHYEGTFDCTSRFILTSKGQAAYQEIKYRQTHKTQFCHQCGESVFSATDHMMTDGMGFETRYSCAHTTESASLCDEYSKSKKDHRKSDYVNGLWG